MSRTASAVGPAGPDRQPTQLLTIPEAAAALRIGRSTLYELLNAGKIPTVRLGTRRFVPAAAVEAFITANTSRR